MGKELIFKTLRHEKTDELPWVPFAGVHVGKLKGYTAEEVLRDEDKLVECLLEADVYKRQMVGGAPVTNRWAEKIGADAYCEDASDTVNFIMNWIAEL